MEKKTKRVLIADAGGTKTAWRMLSGDHISSYETRGFNFSHADPELLVRAIREELLPQLEQSPDELHFYGAGITPDQAPIASALLQAIFTNAKISCASDLLGAARALCGHQPGIACIIGTGANAALYDGKIIVNQIRPIGYLLGDEGSGAWLGRELLSVALRKALPSDLQERFDKRYKESLDVTLKQLYRKANAQHSLATYSRFVFHHRLHPWCFQLIKRGFSRFLDFHISPLLESTSTAGKPDEQLSINFTGSIAYYYNSYLREAVTEKGYLMGKITELPVAGMALFHQEQ